MSTFTAKDYSEQTVVDRIIYWGEAEPDTPAFIFWRPEGRYVLSRGDVLDLSSKFAYRLAQQGVKPGDVVCITLPNSPERIITEFGVQLAGAVSMNGQVLRADGKDLAESLVKADCKVIVLDLHQSNGAWNVIQSYFNTATSDSDEGFLHVQSDMIRCVSLIATCTVNRNTNEFIDGLKTENTFSYRYRQSSDIASIFTTSGSTGYSKLVKHSHRNILKVGITLYKILDITPQEKVFISTPLGWAGGYPIAYLYSGYTRVLMDSLSVEPAHLPAFLWKIICEEEIKTAVLLPIHLDRMYECAKTDLKGKTLKNVITGGQPLKKDNLRSVGILTESLTIGYGATELMYITAMRINEEGVNSFQNFSAGFPCEGVQIKIAGTDNPADKRGEILVKSETQSQGYVDTEIKMESLLKDGWFATGDIGYLKENGCLILEGRSSDAIMHGAYIVYPGWMEEKLVHCPGVKEIVIVPVPDPVLYHEICACVIPKKDQKLTAEDVITFSRKQFALDESSPLSVVPKYAVFFEQFPLTVTSKLDRKTLAANATRELGL